MQKLLTLDTRIVFGFIAFISITALAAAFISEAFLGLEPCQLCIYQRYPFAFGFILSVIGILTHKKTKISAAVFLLGAINYIINSVIAFYHTGVEQHWWESKVEGCAMIFPEDTKSKSILENIMSAPMGDCSEIPWQDPILGLSMANYNIGLCAGLAIICLVYAFKSCSKTKEV